MARVLMSMLMVASFAVAANAAALWFDVTGDGLADTEVAMMAGETVVVKMYISAGMIDNFDVEPIVANNSGLEISGAVLPAGFVSEFFGGKLMWYGMTPLDGNVLAATFNLKTTEDGDGLLGVAAGSVGLYGMNGPFDQVTPLAITPEPATLALLAFGAVAAIRRRK